MTRLQLDQVSVSFGGAEPALDRLSLTLESGEFLAVVGPSGCGKTTLLNVAAGFRAPDAGHVLLDGRPLRGPGRERAVVFQDDALFPWLSVADNVGFALRIAGVPAPQRRQRVLAALAEVGLSGHAEKHSWQLSGGQRQRVGLARALIGQPPFLLLDEPLGALDALTREQMQGLLLEVSRAHGSGVLLITHDVAEALLLATRVVVMGPRPGTIGLELRATFAPRAADGEPLRRLKSDPNFVAPRAQLLDRLLVEAA